MKALCLLLLPVLGLLVSSKTLCSMEEAINERIQEVAGSLSFAVTGCTCGSACGSWDVRAETTCHCQCAGMDWTGARCCRVQP
ncbi:resistin [Homo sapiens]|uniref:Isoform 2 of Resistin n=1 Tax=Homo sapiens TaxID=9606 RepID=Q9HD89-2|nr:resistin isoform c precursor [Homo sapiens]KAI2588349.1 resistin [Homo sapiens]KAI2588350.1 resistin [Homo sapiens]KAI4040019.1 resistin [Homo sapiens]KAI4040020.1 resistin [Homo sapiens]BAD04068.1 resistin delta2 [Homo sapiens]